MSSSLVRRPLEGAQFEIVVIGGGINGVAVARECARAGRSVLVMEQNDFASGTTSRSTRIIHGGLRYLQHGEIGLVRESLRERDRLVRERPHLVRPLRFALALDQDSRLSSLQIRAGLWLYRQFAGQRWDISSQPSTLRALEVELDRGRQWSLFEYDDAQCEFPERLVAEWMSEAEAAGAAIYNYTVVLDILQSQGRVTGVVCRDRLTGRESTVRCKHLINASGPWVDQVCADANVPTGGPLIGGIRGSHIVLPRFAGAPDSAIYTQALDRRPVFVIPWNQQILVGTTEIPDSNDPSIVAPSAEEIAYLVQSVNSLFPGAKINLSDVNYAFAGIRPLPYVKGAEPSAITRKAILYDHEQDGVAGMISIIGGKLTTAASLARRVATAIGIRQKPFTEIVVPIGTASGLQSVVQQWARITSRELGIPESVAADTASLYGPRALPILRLAASDSRLAIPLCPHTRHIVAEALHALKSQHAVTLADVLLRRTPAALGPCWAPECSRTAAAKLAACVGWDEEETEWQIETLEIERGAFLRKSEPARLPDKTSSPAQRLA